MLRLRSIRAKITLGSGLALLVACGVLITSSAVRSRSEAVSTAQRQVQAAVDGEARALREPLTQARDTAVGLAQVLGAVKDEEIGLDLTRENVTGILRSCLSSNSGLLGVFTCWEPDAFDGLDIAYGGVEGHDDSGRFVPMLRREGGEIELVPCVGYDGSGQSGGPSGWYDPARGQTLVSEPFAHPSGRTAARITVPVRGGGTVHGVVGVDFDLGYLAELLARADVYDPSGVLSVVTPSGFLIADSRGADTGRQEASITTERRVALEQDELVCTVPVALDQSSPLWVLRYVLPSEAITAGVRAALRQQLLISLAVVAVALALIGLLAHGVGAPVGHAARMLHEIGAGQGDLGKRLPVRGRDELAELAIGFNAFADKIYHLIAEAVTALEDVEQGSRHVRSTSDLLSTSATQESASIQEMTSSLESIAQLTQENTQSVFEACSMSAETVDAANNGRTEMERLTDCMNQMKGSSVEISKVIGMIDGIAFQTNLLALNAAVEAARAGEAGKGFAVVAEEVRDLAQRSAQAARETASMIDTSQQRADEGVRSVAGVSQALADINERACTVSELMRGIGDASEQQRAGMEEAKGGIQHLEHLVQNNAGSAEELAASANETSVQVDALRRIMARFNLGSEAPARADGGGRWAPSPPAPLGGGAARRATSPRPLASASGEALDFESVDLSSF